MNLRRAYIVEDIALAWKGFFDKLVANTAPWTSWAFVLGYPESSVFETLTKPFIYIEYPIRSGGLSMQGSSEISSWSMTIGCWDARQNGSVEEINIMGSHIINILTNKQSLKAVTFNITLGGTTYSNTTIPDEGIIIGGITGPRPVYGENDIKEFKSAMTIEFVC